MLSRHSADRIIVKSNAKMQMVLDWYFANFDRLDQEPFLAPMEAGIVELQEEQIEFTFEKKENLVEIIVYVTAKPRVPAVVSFDYDPTTTQILNRKVDPSGLLKGTKLMELSFLVSMDDMCRKEAQKYHSLMLFMSHYREYVSAEKRVTKRPIKQKKKGRAAKRPQPLISRVYLLTDFHAEDLHGPEMMKRHYTKPDHEVSVRGYYRHYKSGKTVWVRPSVRYKGKNKQPKEYEL